MLNTSQIEQFHKEGFLLTDIFKPEEVKALTNEIPILFDQDSPQVFRQKENGAIRTVFAPDRFSELFSRVYKLDLLVGAVKQLLEDDVYLFQYKFNTKVALKQGSWDWHQDFTFWKDDGMPAPKAITVAIYLNDVTEFSGGLVVIPGSHKLEQVVCTMQNAGGVHDENLKYVIGRETIQAAAQKCGGMVSTKGKKGTVLFFHSNLLHASAQNLYYENRDVLMLTYNSVKNKTCKIDSPRADYMVQKDFEPIKTVHSLLS